MTKFIRPVCSIHLYEQLEFEIKSGKNLFKILSFVSNIFVKTDKDLTK